MTSQSNVQNGPNVTDRLVREHERRAITSISRSHAWILEQKGLFPARRKIGSRSVCWKLSELLEWCDNQPKVEAKK